MHFPAEMDIFDALQIDGDEDMSSLNRRSPPTVERYRYQAARIMRRAGTPEVPSTIGGAIDLLVTIAPTLRHSTCRQYRAALLQALRDLYVGGALALTKVSDYLRRLGLLGGSPLLHGHRDRLPVRCGAGRRRGLSKDTHRETVFRLRELRTPMATTLANILVVGDMVGLRPWEWPTAWVQDGWILIPSAKMSDRMGRGLVPVRALDLKPLGRAWVETIASISDDLQKELERDGTPERTMKRYSRLLRACRVDTKMTLRSTRHQFRKNAQTLGWRSVEIAVAMNHASAKSQLAYGRDTKGRRGLKLPGIDHFLVESVRPSRPDPKARYRVATEGFPSAPFDEDTEDFTHVPRPR